MAQLETISSPLGAILHQTNESLLGFTSVTSNDIGVPSTLSSLQDKDLPNANNQDFDFDPSSLKARYKLERDKRLAANPDGVDQYRSIEDGDPVFGHYIDDPYIERTKRAPVSERLEALIVGGGYGGQLVAVRLMEMGITDIRIVEKGGDFGGTWYWNRYPGAQCDIESYVYMPLLDETGYVPTEKYARNEELLEHARMIGRRYSLYPKTIFQTEIKNVVWDSEISEWVAHSDRGDIFRARFFLSAAGPLHRPKLPGIRGIESFQGHSFHSSRWDYDYTGGNSTGHLHKLADKRVGIIGTGATSVQIVPHLADHAKQLYVFQRTPSSIDVRGNRMTDPGWVKSLGDHWQKRRMDNFNIIVNGGHQDVDLVADGWTDIIRKLAINRPTDPENPLSAEELAKQRQLYDYEKMEQIRSRVDSIVADPQTAAKLKPYYNQFCKRPCFHDEYLQSFNNSNVQLVDTDGKGIEGISEKGVIANGVDYELDCLIYATGFDLATDWTQRSGFEVTGKDGVLLSEKWKDGASTLHGWTTHGFPNFFMVQILQAALTPNFMHVTADQAMHFAYVISEAKKRNIKTLQPTQEAEDKWVETIVGLTKLRESFQKECTPGYYNNEGIPSLKLSRNASYGGGPLKFLQIMEDWRVKGDLDGLEIEHFENDNPL